MSDYNYFNNMKLKNIKKLCNCNFLKQAADSRVTQNCIHREL